jgi:UDP-glucuronate 4-epimerase
MRCRSALKGPPISLRVVNIGNSDRVKLTDFVDAIEAATGRQAIRNYMEMQK